MTNDFNCEAMEQKIKDNIVRGFSVKKTEILLLEEQLENTKKIFIAEQRNVELQDQIEYIRTNYAGK